MDKKKGKLRRTMVQRTMGILLAVVMVFNTLPISSVAVFAADTSNEPALIDEPEEGTVAKVEKEGEDPIYVTSLADAFAEENSGATITLLEDVEVSGSIRIDSGNFTLNLNSHTINSNDGWVFCVNDPSVSLTICGSGAVQGGINQSIQLNAGTLTLEGGHFSNSNAKGLGIYALSGTLNVTGASVIIEALGVSSGANVSLSAGTYIGEQAIKRYGANSTSSTLNKLLLNYGEESETNYAYYGADGDPLPLDGVGEWDDEMYATVLTGPVTVRECTHVGNGTFNGNETHSINCLACGYIGTGDCTYSDEYTSTAEGHVYACMFCGNTKTEEHITKLTAEANGTVITVRDVCETCGYINTLGTLTLTVPANLTYNDGQMIAWEASPELEEMLDASLAGKSIGVRWINEEGYGAERAYFESIPVVNFSNTDDEPLPAGEYSLGVTVDNTTNPSAPKYAECIIPVTVAKAPVTEDMVTLSLENATYSGAEQKPTITVQKGETTLAEGTDYEVSYSRNDAATTDFTNAGTVKFTVTGKGNYTGTVERTYTIAQAELTIKASDQEITYGESITQGADNVTAAGLCDGDSLEGITLTANIVSVPGGSITPSAASIKNSSGGDVTGNYAITYQTGVLTIGRAEGTLTVPETSISKNFGDGEFSLNCSTNGDGKISYASSNEKVASVSTDGTVLIKGAGETIITVSLAEGTNYTGSASREIAVTVAKAVPPTIVNETRNYTCTKGSDGAVTIDVAEKLPKDRGETEYTVAIAADEKGILSDVSMDENGNLVYTVLGNKSEGDTVSITVTAQMENYENAAYTMTITLLNCEHENTERKGMIAATCTADGYTGDTYCTDCKAKTDTGTVITATGHSWNITSEKAATTTSEGKRVYTCSKCSQTREESIPKLPSSPTESIPKLPSSPTESISPEKVEKNSEKLDSSISAKWKGNALALIWPKITGAEGYDIFAAQYGKKLNEKSPTKTVKKGKTSVSLTKIGGKKISGNKVYYFTIKAWKYVGGKKVYIGSSKTYYVAGNTNGKYTNAKKLQPAKKKYVLKKGQNVSIKATIVKQSKKKKLLPKSYGPSLQYQSSNKKIATVTSKGKVKAKKKGTCYIYVTALNGMRTKIKITVK